MHNTYASCGRDDPARKHRLNRIPDKERLFYELKKIMISYGESDRFCRVAAGKEKIKERAKIAFRSSIIV